MSEGILNKTLITVTKLHLKNIGVITVLVIAEVPSTMSQDSQEDVLIECEVEDVDHHDSQMVSQMSEDEVDESQNVGEEG